MGQKRGGVRSKRGEFLLWCCGGAPRVEDREEEGLRRGAERVLSGPPIDGGASCCLSEGAERLDRRGAL